LSFAEGHTLREVEKLLGLSRSMVRGLILAGFVTPSRGQRGEYRFNFQDLVLLRAARGLVDAKVSNARILRSLRRLRSQLPDSVPLSGLRVEAVGDSVVVVDGDSQWQPDNGQYVIRFQVEAPKGRLAFLDAPTSLPPMAADDLFAQAVALESSDPEAACAAYRSILSIESRHDAPYINLGRLLHSLGDYAAAEATYLAGLAKAGPSGVLLFNLGVLLEDMDRPGEAADRYREALKESPDLLDAHYNLAALCQASGLTQEAFRHLSAFRKLGGKFE
jgi:tetratricopeptide (TPR) repeat protein